MRLDVFLPFLKKPKQGKPPKPEPAPIRVLRRVLPGSLFANRATAKAGAVRFWLKRFGPTWLSSPVRRVVQSACLLLFLWLFFVVCYPYDARPSREWPDWRPQGIDEQNRITLLGNIHGELPGIGTKVFAASDRTQPAPRPPGRGCDHCGQRPATRRSARRQLSCRKTGRAALRLGRAVDAFRKHRRAPGRRTTPTIWRAKNGCPPKSSW